MRILHTSDWHVGRTFHGHSTLEALEGVLDALVAAVSANQVDIVAIAGDLFDSSAPSAAAYRVLGDALRKLADTGAVVVATSGNHDSAARLGFQAALLREGVHVLTDPADLATPVTVERRGEIVQLYGIPYLEPANVRHLWPGKEIRSHQQAIEHAMALITEDAAARDGAIVVLAHCFSSGVQATPGLERDVTQGGLDLVAADLFDTVDYAALGHLHGRQRVSERAYYSGAPLHYSFGEGDKPRGAWLVDISSSAAPDPQWVDLPIPRRLVTLRGTFADVTSSEVVAQNEGAWVRIEYTDPTPVSDPMRKLQALFPFCAAVSHTPEQKDGADLRRYADRLRQAVSDEQRISSFLTHVREGEGASETENLLLRDVLAEVEKMRAER